MLGTGLIAPIQKRPTLTNQIAVARCGTEPLRNSTSGNAEPRQAQRFLQLAARGKVFRVQLPRPLFPRGLMKFSKM
jgi:hypothetical protein